jgi:hypothetical protein
MQSRLIAAWWANDSSNTYVSEPGEPGHRDLKQAIPQDFMGNPLRGAQFGVLLQIANSGAQTSFSGFSPTITTPGGASYVGKVQKQTTPLYAFSRDNGQIVVFHDAYLLDRALQPLPQGGHLPGILTFLFPKIDYLRLTELGNILTIRFNADNFCGPQSAFLGFRHAA